MPSKNSKVFLAVVVILMGFSAGCSRFIGSAKPKNNDVQLGSENLRCLSEVSSDLDQFASGKADEATISKSIDCVRNGLEYFVNNTRGSEEGRYTIDDVHKFFSKYMLKSQDLDKDLVRDLMKFKQAVFGGSSQSVSSEEISKGGNLLEKMKSYSIEARLLIPILWLDEKQAYPIQDIDTLQSIMKRFWKDMVVETQLPRSDYTFDDLNSMVDHLGIFMRGREGFASVRKAQSWMPTIKVVKSLLIGKQARIYEKADWIRAGESILSAFTFFMKYKYHWGKKELSNPKDLTDLMIGGNELLSVIEGAFSVYHTGMMFSDIDQLEEILLERKLSNPFGKDQEGKDLFRGFVRLLVARSLEPVPHSDGNSLDMLTAQNVKILRRIYLRWQLGQVWIQNQFQDASELRILKIKESMNETSYLQTLTSMRSMGLVLNAEDLVQLRSSWLEFQTIFQSEKPIHFDTRGGVILNAQEKTGQQTYTWNTMTRMNAMRLLTYLKFNAYAKGGSEAYRLGQTNDRAMTDWYSDFEIYGKKTKVFDPHPSVVATVSGPRSFREASLFTPSGTGQDSIGFMPMFEYITMLVSGGMSNANQVRKIAESANCKTKYVDRFDQRVLSETCLKQVMREHAQELFPNLPGLVKHIQNVNSEDWDQFYANLIGTARGLSVPGHIDHGDLRTMVMILHYIEVLFVMYDKDRNGELDHSEVISASERFLPLLRKKAPGTSTSDLRNAFAFVVFTGQYPKTETTAEKLIAFVKLTWFQSSLTRGEYGPIGRNEIMRTFLVLKEQLK